MRPYRRDTACDEGLDWIAEGTRDTIPKLQSISYLESYRDQEYIGHVKGFFGGHREHHMILDQALPYCRAR
jgi:hypothetical protein